MIAQLENVQVKVDQCYLVHGKIEKQSKYSSDVMKKNLQLCEPEAKLEAY